MESTLVIKVKYGDTLRRFSARVDENNQLDLDMVGLRAKICSLFNFTADANLMLKYVDEDGDLVTLVDDDDLHDVMRQRLKFLRIDVHVSNGSGGKSSAWSSGSATPLRSPLANVVIAPDSLKCVPEPLREAVSKLVRDLLSSSPELNYLVDVHMSNGSGGNSNARSSGSATPLRSPPVRNPYLSGNVAIASDALKSVPEPLREAVSKLSLDLVSKASSSSPVLANLVDSASKMGHSSLNSHCQPHVAAGPSSKSAVPEEPVTSEARGPQFTCVDSTSSASQQVEAGNVTGGLVHNPVDLNILPCDSYSSQSTNVNSAPPSLAIPDGDDKKGKMSTNVSFAGKGESSGMSTSSAAPNSSSTQTTAINSSAFVDCPFSGTYTIDSGAPSLGIPFPSFKRSHSHTEATSGMFHKGVRCDGCGVYPITGPRFKSKVKENYDLCSICFNEVGNETDYIRMDRPLSVRGIKMDGPVRALQCFKGVYEHPPWMGAPTLPHVFKTDAILKHARPKLDSRFILDVNVIDGTMMAPSTAFTKIWRMRNNGTLVWPNGTKLVWIGGDKFSDSHAVDLEVPEDGIAVDKELDIAVDFRAPQLPGRYISYWRMASPSGQKFGQRVWVLIQVDASLKDSFYDSAQGLNLNIPLDVSGSKGPQIIDINVQPTEDDTFPQPHIPNAPTEPVNQMVDTQPRQELENEFPINEATSVGPAASPPANSAAPSPSPVSYPIIDFSETVPAVPSNQQSSAVDPATSAAPSPSSVSYPIIDFSETAPGVPSDQKSSAVDAPSSLGIGGNNSVEETLLKELEEMGFKQVDLNKEILRMNEYNLEQSVDHLCGVSEWDPILEELQEMGFRDNEMNKRLLMKNNGSIKRVVMDLINGESV